jgi:hypothetical protein
MSRIKFRIGGSPGVTINLPSRKHQDGSICIGNVIADIYGLQCSERLSFTTESILIFSKNCESLYKILKGKACISSICNTFVLCVSADSTGHIKVEVNMKKYQFSQPNNAEWKAEGCFHSNPECLEKVIKIQHEIKS